MAATLCKYIFVKPCEACGKCCDEMSKCLANACECCRPCWEYMENFCERPFAMTLSFIFFIVFAPALALIAISGMAVGGPEPDGCVYGMMPMWGLVFALICFIDFGIAIYIFCKFNEPYDFNNPKDKSYTTRMQRLLCEDCVVALYICVLLFKFIWLIMGSVWDSPHSALSACPNGFSTMISCMQIFGYLFFGIGGALIMWHWFYVTCCPQHADAAAQKQMERQQRRQAQRNGGGQQQYNNGGRQPVVATMNRNNNNNNNYTTPTYQAQQQQPVVVHQQQQHMPVATAQPVYNNQPQVVVHQPARTANANTGAAKQPETTSQKANKLFASAKKGIFGR